MRHRWYAAVVFTIGSMVETGVAAAPADEALIRDVEARQALVWNQHDAGAYADLFTEDGDVVNVLGWWWQGRAQISSRLSDAFAWIFRDSTLTVGDVHVRFLDPETAIVHVRWTMDGAKAPPGAPAPREGIQLQILGKTEGRWLIASFQNTNSAPEAPFPKAPPSPPVLKPS
jgi:uncharacterized protein (TIGR02246 family)